MRLPAPLHLRLVHLASAGGRSLNSEIVRRLEHSVAVESPLSADAQRVLAQLDEGMKRRDKLEAELLRALARIAPKELKKVIGQVYGEEDKSSLPVIFGGEGKIVGKSNLILAQIRAPVSARRATTASRVRGSKRRSS